jgi:transcriptional regulator of acetoin/glycerol metabolism
MNLGEWHHGTHGIAAPIAEPDGRVTAAISVVGPAERMQAKKLRSLAPLVVDAAAAITLHLAYAAARVEPLPEGAPRGARPRRTPVPTPA